MRIIFRLLLRFTAGLIVLGIAGTIFIYQPDEKLFAFMDQWTPVVAAMIGLCILEAFVPIKK